MDKQFLRNIGFLVFVNLIVKPVWVFGIDRTVQNTVGLDEYGIYFKVFNYVFLFHVLLDFGINLYNSREIAQYPDRLNRNFYNVLLIKVLLTIVYLTICIAGAYWAGFNAFQWKLMLFLCINQIFISYITYFRSNLQGLHLFRKDSYVSVMDRCLMIIMCSVLLWSGWFASPIKIEWFVYVQTLAYGLVVITGFALVLQQTKNPLLQWDKALLITIVKESYPFALLGVLMGIYYRIDGVMIEEMLPDGAVQTGIYAQSYRLIDAVNTIGVLFSAILVPMFSRMLKHNEDINELVGLSARLLFVVSTTVAIPCYFYRQEIMDWLYVDSSSYGATVLGGLIFSFIASSSVYVYGSLLGANKSLWPLNGIVLFGAMLNVGLNYTMIPGLKALGATYATLITQFLVALLHIIVAVKILRLQIHWKSIAQAILFFILCGATVYGLTYLNIHFLIALLLAALLCLFIAFLSGFIQFQKIRQLFIR